MLVVLPAMLASTAECQDANPLVLAENGQTRYAIVIAAKACEAEQYAAKELAHFLKDMTGAEFPTKLDDALVSNFEIVLGNTNRKALDEFPPQLKPQAWEGFTILPEDARLYIMGNIPRATLYGVYDFLEQELGVRFITPEFTHVPRRAVLKVDIIPRRFDPVLEYRALWGVQGSDWAIRNRLNAVGEVIPAEKMLGGVRYAGPPWHTFNSLVPVEKYFKDHPEYFSMKNGKRISERTQLCLTNPEVYQITLDALRNWIQGAMKSSHHNPDTLLMVSITQNDWTNWCECPNCKAIDQQEGGPTGSYMRFVNKVAEALDKDFPNVAVVMFGYAYTQDPPKKTRPRDNVIVMFANHAAIREPLGYSHPRRAGELTQVRRWGKVTSRLYTWDYITNFRAYADPCASLWVQDSNMRTLVANNLKGYFGQCSQTKHAELFDLRMYLAAKCAWRPNTDGRKTIDEFCRLYFGPAADAILEYIELYHSPCYEGKGLETKGDYIMKRLLQNDEFLARADAILDRAEKLADTPERKMRVANHRLGIWDHIVQQEAERAADIPKGSYKLPEQVRIAGERFIDVTTKLDMSHYSEFYGKRRSQFEDKVYPRIRTLLERK